MYIYEKFFTVTKVHGYKIISIQRCTSSLSPPLPNPSTPRRQHSALRRTVLGKLRALWMQISPSSAVANMMVIYTGPCLTSFLHFPFPSFWGGESRQVSLALGGMEIVVSLYSSRAGKDVRAISTKTSTGKRRTVGIS
ncbi:hypothetical protein mRhiFer1_008188 [Rhinolophus ferrumequinum]|uniref:Uncharacterized protein n=1 Tax=Rhinolophus ferrumequinum TaxID=59479 RepID=A0A7J7W885_RHIFE|nr:hypothetical protein mRhiFer1_008188 [Rhinolophus ferrumequinum]